MNDKQFEESLAALHELRNEVQSSKKAAREFLIRLGVLTKKGKLRKRARPQGPLYGPGPTYHSLSAYKKRKLKKELKNRLINWVCTKTKSLEIE